MARRAVIIGTGGAGLAALHAMHEAGCDAGAFEQNDELGGIWATTKYPSLTIHSIGARGSDRMTIFSRTRNHLQSAT